MIKNIIVSLAILVQPFAAQAWGPVGHYTVGLIAEPHLTPTAKSEIKNLLGHETLADVANWADSLKDTGTHPQTRPYHYEKIPDGTNFIDNIKQMPDREKAKGGVVSAILFAREILKNKTAPRSEQIDALKFIVHFVGDIHQPLHTGLPADKGGVKIDVDWFGHPSNLHRIWDSGMMATGHPNLMNGKNYAKYLEQTFSPSSVSTKLEVEQWLNESLALRPPLYNPIYKTNQALYQSLHLKDLDQRIFTAGIRLAALLNDVFAGKPLPVDEVKLWQDIENASGRKMDRLISFKP